MGLTVLLMVFTIGIIANSSGYGFDKHDNTTDTNDINNKQERNLRLYNQPVEDDTTNVSFRNAISQEQGSFKDFSVYSDVSTHIHILKDSPNCVHVLATLTCRTIPKQIPSGVKTLYVSNQETDIPFRPFLDASFANLSVFLWNGLKLNVFSESTFEGLERLINLTLTGMDALDGSSLQLAISKQGILPRLKYLALNPGESFKWPFLSFESGFLQKLAKNRMDCFNFSNVIAAVKIRDLAMFTIVSKLSVLNFTGSFLMIDYSLSYGYMNLPLYYLSQPFVKVLDVSRVRTANITDSNIHTGMYTSDMGTVTCNGTHPTYFAFALVEVLYANELYSGPIHVEGVCSTSVLLLRKIVFSGNNVVKLNLTLLLPHKNSVYFIDMSNNKLEYINPAFFAAGFFIEELYLNSNRLNRMAHLQDFEKLLRTMIRLEIFDLADNNISFIPPKMFRSNECLNTLILANNHLTTVSFELGHLSKLSKLDLRNNAITTLDNIVINKLNLLLIRRKENLSIMMAGNRIQCVCESVNFVIWLASLHVGTKEHVYCRYMSDDIKVDKDAVSKCKYLCKRTLIIVVSIGCSIVTVALLLSTAFVFRRVRSRMMRKNIEGRLRQLIEDGNFVCFMAISGDDEPLVNRLILENLQRLLMGKFGFERDLVCTGIRFKPGFPICEEAYRLVKNSQVFVAVVSESFMRSQYCRLELQEACKQNKPTILILLGHMKTDDMPQYMQELFRRNSRAWIKQNDEGYYYVVPTLIDLTDAIWDLAIQDLLQNT